jgi:CTP synthase (UTP-ammonia lyase)
MPQATRNDADGAGHEPVVRLAIIGEYNPAFPPHKAVDATVVQVAAARGIDVRAEWISTAVIAAESTARLAGYHAIWISPGSPYKSLDGALAAVRYAREQDVPLLGTCGGFQHVVLEFARNVMGLEGAEHEETAPDASVLVVTALSCSPAGQTMPVTIDGASRVAGWYGTTRIAERYYCNYGLNPEHEVEIEDAGLRIVGWDDGGEARIVDIPSHPFYIGALFVPHPPDDPSTPHPLVAALIEAGRPASRFPLTTPQVDVVVAMPLALGPGIV